MVRRKPRKQSKKATAPSNEASQARPTPEPKDGQEIPASGGAEVEPALREEAEATLRQKAPEARPAEDAAPEAPEPTVPLEQHQRLLAEFDKLGLSIEPFGPNAYAVTTVPALLAGRPAGPLVREIVEKTLDIGVTAGMNRIVDEALKLMACHGAIRARQALSTPQMETLLAQLDDCQNPFHCPHGRPTWIRWSHRELEKSFGRIV